MAHSIHLPSVADKETTYRALLPQAEALLRDESDTVANMANLAAILREAFGFFWVGFYRVVGDQLVLGPFQGPVACTRIHRGKGVCGTAWQESRTIIVPDVDLFPGHIACNSASRSEIVVPLFDPDEKVIGVLDIDSDRPDSFDETDARYLEQLTEVLLPRRRGI